MTDDVKNIRRVLGPTLKYVDGRIDVVNPGGEGEALPSGGSTGQVLTKQSNADGDADWEDATGGSGLPNGGSTGTALIKNSGTDGDASWQAIHQVPAGGSTSQVLSKTSGTDYSYSWADASAGTGLPDGGIEGQTLVKLSGTDGDADWGFISPPGFPYIYIPTSPDAWDMDPSLWTTADLNANGWDIRAYSSPYGALTRVGEVDAGVTSTGEYRSSLKGGQLWIQLHASTSDADIAVMTKATSGAFTYKIDAWSSCFGPGYYAGNYNRCFAALFSGAAPNVADAATNCLLFGIDRSTFYAYLFSGASLAVLEGVSVTESKIPNIKYADVFSAVTAYWRSVNRFTGVTVIPRSSAINTLGAVSYVGITLATSGGEYCYINSIRRVALGTFP